MNKVGKFNITLSSEYIDFTGHATMKTIAGMILYCATENAKENGFSLSELQSKGVTWVLSKLRIDMDCLPVYESEIEIETWISGVYDYITERGFAFYQNGVQIGTASTMWAILDINSRKVVELSTYDVLTDCVVERDIVIEDADRVRCVDSVEFATRKVRYSDLDINNHVNSLKYIEWVFDAIPIEQHENNPFHTMMINYQQEVMYGSEASIRKSVKKEHHYDIFNSEGVNTTKIMFKPKQV